MQTDLNGERLYDLRLTQINFRGKNDDVSFHISKYFVYKKAPATACVEQLAPFTSSQPHLIAKAEASDILWRKACIHHLLPSVTAQSSWPQKQSASDVDLDTELRTTRTDQNIPVSNGLIGVNKALSLKVKVSGFTSGNICSKTSISSLWRTFRPSCQIHRNRNWTIGWINKI